MASFSDVMQMCRLCLVKDQVNLPIFGGQGDIQQIFLKITACLPVKVSREDNLPKNICDGCSYKLDMLYQFWNTSSNSEKQLIDWLNAAGVDPKHKSLEPPLGITTQPNVILKQEPVTELDSISSDAQNYIMQQQQLAYKPEEFDSFQKDPQAPTSTKNKATESAGDTPSKRPRRATRNPVAVVDDEDDDDYMDNVDANITKTEDDSDEDDDDGDGDGDGDGDDDDDGGMPDAEPDFDTLDDDADQPGPSGVSGGKSTTGPCIEEEEYIEEGGDIEQIFDHDFQCEVCGIYFNNRNQYLEHHMAQFGSRFSCCRCGDSFKNTTELYQHYEAHRLEPDTEYIVADEIAGDVEIEEAGEVEQDDEEVIYDDEQVEAVINIPGDRSMNTTQELLYILDDDNQCINEVIIETAGDQTGGNRKAQTTITSSKADYSVVQVDHGYIIPACFRGQLDAKKRLKKNATYSIQIADTEDDEPENVVVEVKPSTSSIVYSSEEVDETSPKSKIPPPRRRHDIPDFSATSYEIINPNSEVEIVHYKCLRCEQLFINKFVFFRHIEKGKCYINSCDVCPMTFTKNTNFYNHYVTDHTERAICNFCFRTFMYEKNVKEHMLRHLDQFRHRCEECNKGFYTVREYRNHYKNRHMGIRHKCTECGRSFADEYYFKKHIATHGLKIAEIVE